MTRLERIREGFAEASVEALVVTDPVNVRYLSGFAGSFGALVLTADQAWLVTDSRYDAQARELAHRTGSLLGITITRDLIGAAGGHLAGSARIGLEADAVTWSELDRWKQRFDSVVATSGLVERLRETKSETEVDTIRRAAGIADTALEELRDELGPGRTELAVANRLDDRMRSLGADRPGFDTIIASGPNSARPHHRPGDRMLESGDLVVIDFGAEVDGYRSDMTRSFVIGEPTGRQSEMLEAVRRAQQAGVEKAGPSVAIADVDRACRESLTQDGLDEFFTHGTGHGVGLRIHEAPWVNARATGTLAPGHVITVEPGVYVPGVGGVRWEDTIAITETGVDVLTRAPKDPVLA